ncbi:GntR family transcriptional regulator [Phyllobacterium zundukense]|nr:GntR family transcriptional regulator [Phyllobacterium zundukense]
MFNEKETGNAMEQERFIAQIKSGVDRLDSEIPQHKRLKTSLQRLITDESVECSPFLPAERVLADALSLSRVTVRKAIDLLAEDGLVRRRHGAKTEINRPVQKSLSTLASFSEDMVARGMEPGCIWISKEIGRPSPAEAMALGLPPHAEIVRLKRIRTADGKPVAYETAAVPAKFLPSPLLVDQSLYEALAKRHALPQRAMQRLRSRPATAKDSTLLECAVGAPLLIIERLCFLADEQAVEFTETRYRGDLYDFVVELSR